MLPVVPDFSHLDVPPDTRILDDYDDEWTNVLFVGRVIPNKRPDDLIRFFHAYKTLFNPRSRLILAGAHSGFDMYLAQLHALTARLGVSDVHVLGQVTNEELAALYGCADLFLCASLTRRLASRWWRPFTPRARRRLCRRRAVPRRWTVAGL